MAIVPNTDVITVAMNLNTFAMVFQLSFFFINKIVKSSLNLFKQGSPACSQPPHPPCPKEDLEPFSKPFSNRWKRA